MLFCATTTELWYLTLGWPFLDCYIFVKLSGKLHLHLLKGLNYPNQRHEYLVYTVIDDIAWSNWEIYPRGMVLYQEKGLWLLRSSFWLSQTSRRTRVFQLHVHHLENSKHWEVFFARIEIWHKIHASQNIFWWWYIPFWYVKVYTRYRQASLRAAIASIMKGVSPSDSSLHTKSEVIWLCDSPTYWRKHNAGAAGLS